MPRTLLATVLLLAATAGPVLARDCEALLEANERALRPTFALYRCLLAEIEDLKAGQARLERALAAQGRDLDALPTRYENADGAITFEEGRPIGSASFTVTSRRLGGAASLALAPEVVAEVCAAPSGCTVTLTLRRQALLGGDEPAARKIGPCLLEIDPEDGRWLLSAGCAGPGARSGIDGDGNAMEEASGAETILETGGGCLLADADVRRSPGSGAPFAADRAAGLYLVALPAGGAGAARQFSCTLEMG